MLAVDAEMVDVAEATRHSAQYQLDARVGAGHVIVVVVPDHHGQLAGIAGRQDAHVRLAAHAIRQQIVERYLV